MKIRKATMAMLMLAGLAMGPIGCGSDDDPAGVGEVVDSVSLEGNWNMTYTWVSFPRSGNVRVFLSGSVSGLFTTTDGYSGTWSLNGSTFTMIINGGGDAVYTGQLVDSGDSISGTMTSSENNDSGTFTMVRPTDLAN